MKYLQNFNNHDDYSNNSALIPTPGVAYDKEHVHYFPKLNNTIICSYNVTTAGVTAILNEKRCNSLNIASVEVDGADATTIVSYNTYFLTTGKHTVKYTLEKNITSIGYLAFSGCTNLTDVTIGNSITSIDTYAFSNTGLTAIVIPDSVTSIGGFICYGCTALTEVTISKKITSITDCSFYNCSSLTNITISNAVTNIGVDAFNGCTSMDSITYTGNISDWKKITKGSNWHNSVPASTVTCTDGTCGLDDQ
jgi:hypothetical protein